MALALDIKKQESKYLKSVEVEFKPKTGEYRYWDADASEEVVSDVFDGIVVGTGFQFRGNIGNPTKKKSVNYVSEDFSMETLKNGEISVREFVRDNGNLSNKSMGKKTYKAWKDDGLKIHRTVFVIKPENPEVVYKICFSAVASIDVGKAMTADIPNFITSFGVASEQFSTDNGDFYVPSITRVKGIDEKLEPTVGEWLGRVKEALNGNGDVPQEPTKASLGSDHIPMEDIPF